MRVRRLSKSVVSSAAALMTGLILLVAVDLWLPQAFTIVLAIGGLIGALVVVYEVRLTKQIAQAEFIRDLNDSFLGDQSIGELWKKLLLNEPIGSDDRFRMSAYLTFFETLFVLLGRGVLEFALIDNLFRNRFFRAMGNPGIHAVVLHSDPEAFANLLSLMRAWRVYLRANGVRLPDGYYAFDLARHARSGFELRPLAEQDVDEVLGLQDRVLQGLRDESWITPLPAAGYLDRIVSHAGVGVFHDDGLVAAGFLVKARGRESDRESDTPDSVSAPASGDLELVLVDPRARRLGLAKMVVEGLERTAIALRQPSVQCAVHVKNRAARQLFQQLGYTNRKRLATRDRGRRVFQLELPHPSVLPRPNFLDGAPAGLPSA